MKSFSKSVFFPIIISVVAYTLMLLWGISGITGDEMGYSLLCFYLFAPALGVLCGFFAGRKRSWIKWLFPLTGFLNWFVAYIVFGRSGGRFILAEFILLTLIATVPAIFGIFAGAISGKRRLAKGIDKMSAQDLG